jgi:hypothetical protein
VFIPEHKTQNDSKIFCQFLITYYIGQTYGKISKFCKFSPKIIGNHRNWFVRVRAHYVIVIASYVKYILVFFMVCRPHVIVFSCLSLRFPADFRSHFQLHHSPRLFVLQICTPSKSTSLFSSNCFVCSYLVVFVSFRVLRFVISTSCN